MFGLKLVLGEAARFDAPVAKGLAAKLSAIRAEAARAQAASTTPQPTDNAESEDPRLSPAIRAEAAELGNDPVRIGNWVYNIA